MQNGNSDSYLVIDYYVIVFDLCSSSIMLEDLQNQNKLLVWKKFWEFVSEYLNRESDNSQKYIIYKFLSDGFIILFNPKHEKEIIEFCADLTHIIMRKLAKIIENDLSIEPDRIGITIGVEKGELINIKVKDNEEYMGKAINVASRLQSSLKEPDHANKLLISKNVKNRICKEYTNEYTKNVERSLPNLFGNKRFYCYEVDMIKNPKEYLKDE